MSKIHVSRNQESLFDFIIKNAHNEFRLCRANDFDRIKFFPILKSKYLSFINDKLLTLESKKFKLEGDFNTFEIPIPKINKEQINEKDEVLKEFVSKIEQNEADGERKIFCDSTNINSNLKF